MSDKPDLEERIEALRLFVIGRVDWLDGRTQALEALDEGASATLARLETAIKAKQIEMPAWLKMTATVDQLIERIAKIESWGEPAVVLPKTTPDEAMAAQAEIQNAKCVACGSKRWGHSTGTVANEHEFVTEYDVWYLCPVHPGVQNRACCEAVRRQEPLKQRTSGNVGPVDPNILDEVLKRPTPPLAELSDEALLKVACEMLDGVLHDSKGTGFNDEPTTEAEILAATFKVIRDKVIKTAVRLAVPYTPDVSVERDTRRTIVCLCGSTRFSKAFEDANLAETFAGKIVLTVGSMTHSDDELSHCAICGKVGKRETLMGDSCGNSAIEPHRIERSLTPEVKEQLDALHKDKIAMADEVLVLNVIACKYCKRTREAALPSGCGSGPTSPMGKVPQCSYAPYIGESTKSEIEHALNLKKRIRFLNPQGPLAVVTIAEYVKSTNYYLKSLGLTTP